MHELYVFDFNKQLCALCVSVVKLEFKLPSSFFFMQSSIAGLSGQEGKKRFSLGRV